MPNGNTYDLMKNIFPFKIVCEFVYSKEPPINISMIIDKYITRKVMYFNTDCNENIQIYLFFITFIKHCIGFAFKNQDMSEFCLNLNETNYREVLLPL